MFGIKFIRTNLSHEKQPFLFKINKYNPTINQQNVVNHFNRIPFKLKYVYFIKKNFYFIKKYIRDSSSLTFKVKFQPFHGFNKSIFIFFLFLTYFYYSKYKISKTFLFFSF